MMSTQRKILITGASGHVGQVLVRAWQHTHKLTLIDVNPRYPMYGSSSQYAADVCDEAAMRTFCKGQDTVVHLAIGANLHASLEELTPVNLQGTHNIMRVAASSGCRRFVLASSLAIDLYSQNEYSQAKLTTERWAKQITQDTSLSIHCLRLGRVLPAHHRAVWPGVKDLDFVLTHRDLVKLFTCSVNAPKTVHFGIYNGISRNQPASHSILKTQEVLGYDPEDNAHKLAQRNFHSITGLLRRLRWAIKKIWN